MAGTVLPRRHLLGMDTPMSEYLHINPSGRTWHMPSGRMKLVGYSKREVTYCGLFIFPLAVRTTMDDPPEPLCAVCRKRSELPT